MRALALAAVLLLLVAACGGGDEPDAPADEPATTGTNAVPPGHGGYAAETLAEGFEVPWDVARLPDGALLVTERGGTIRVVEHGEVAPEPLAEVPVAARGEGGLLGLALHPEFPDEPWLYAYATRDEGNAVLRFRLEGRELGGEEVLLDGIPAASIHNGGRVAFGPDGLLYVGTGDAGRPELAADRASPAGKILRLTPAGDVPDDNPFAGSPVWSYGHRNVQGLAWDGEGTMYAAEHGPSGEFGLCCHDELNRIERGGFYGWPMVAGESEAAGGAPPAEPVAPLAESGGADTWAPGGIAVVDAGEGPAVLLAELAGERLQRVVLAADGGVARVDVVLEGPGRLRHVAAADEGCLLVLTSNRDGRGEPRDGDDRILRLCPDSP